MQEWHDSARCAVTDDKGEPIYESGLWFSEDSGEVEQAKGICAGCPVQTDCLNYAVRAGEEIGVWGGCTADTLHRLRQILAEKDPLKYERSLQEFAAGGKVWRDAGPCTRCGEPVEAGWWPQDKNGPGASCEVVATYNRGCRCWPCREAKSKESAAKSRARKARLANQSPEPRSANPCRTTRPKKPRQTPKKSKSRD